MSGSLADAHARVRIGSVTVHAASAIHARRLADALPAALGRALAGDTARRPGPADRAANEIVAAIESARGSAR